MHKHSKKTKVFFFTLFYPFTHDGVLYDAYSLSEVEQLSRNFDEVVICSSSSEHNGQVDVASNVTVHHLTSNIALADKLRLIATVFQPFFIQEIANLGKIYGRKLNTQLLKAIAVYAAKAAKMKAFLESQLATTDFGKYDITIYCYWNFEYALAASLLKQKYPLKTIVRTHSLDLYFDRVPENYLPFRRFVYLHSNLFLFISEQGQKYFFENHHILPSQQTHALVNRIGTQNSYAPYKHETRRIVLLSNAWIQPLKRIDLLIKALALINDIDIEWIHVGDDYGTNRFPALKKLAADLLDGKRNIVYDFVGRKTLQELYDIYYKHRVNLFINLSTTEGTPVSMMESISFGVPVIGTSVGGVPEIIIDGVNGLLMPADINEQDVAFKIRQWFAMPDQKKDEMSANARRIWADKFEAEKNSSMLIEEILKV